MEKAKYKPPAGAASAARKALNWRDKYGDEVKGGTRVGWTRANQLAKREEVSFDIITRMYSFFSRHEGNEKIDPKFKDTPWKDAGYIAWLIWGGNAGKKWATDIYKNNKGNQMKSIKERTSKGLQRRKLREQKFNYELYMTWYNPNYTSTMVVNQRNAKDVDKMFKEVEKDFIDKTGSDDFWLEDVWLEGTKLNIKSNVLKSLISSRNKILDFDKVKALFDSQEMLLLKVQFLSDNGYDINEDNLKEVPVYDNSKGKDLYAPRTQTRFPEAWVYEMFEESKYANDQMAKDFIDYAIEAYLNVLYDYTLVNLTIEWYGYYFLYMWSY
ncbi:MAG: hypothetical protein GF311_28145 [Candidatus Lokiarchaeota archaeon]|nr:hypothetical protein [Candidatus Lokiarchaeota archaeon]